MTDAAEKPDYKDTVFLPKTDFPMKAGLANKEPAILDSWAAMDLYGRLRTERAGAEKFILHDGPPYANGNIHIGHALNKILKDIIVRSQSLTGKDAPYVPGWDCHGLPIEWKIEERYRKKKRNKDEVPANEFRAECRAYAAEFVDIQREEFKRLGVLGEWGKPYLTMDYAAEAAIVRELLKFAESGQLYRGAKPVMWSPVEKTALAEAEVEYQDLNDTTQIDVAFEIVEAPNAPELVGAHAVVWTTTPWTIPLNQAIGFGEEIEYVLFEVAGRGPFDGPTHPSDERGLASKHYLIASDLLDEFQLRTKLIAQDGAGRKILRGSQLAGAKARHPMADRFSDSEFYTKARPFLPGDFVTTEAGTGLVHLAPDHGEDDFDLCKAHGLGPVFAVEDNGVYRDDWPWLGGADERRGSVINKKFNAPDGPICSDLRAAGALLSASADFAHSYPHSWRSKAKVIYRCTPQWFVPMDRALVMQEADGASEHQPFVAQSVGEGDDPTLRSIAMQAIADTRFVPEKGRNRIGAMVEGRPDWVLSRQRAWGVPIALYVDRKTGDYLVDIEVNARIVAAFEAGGADAWFDADHQALLGDQYDLADYEVVTDILDVWFDSGSTHAFVLEGDTWPEQHSPADLYLEGSDQHRGWFQSSLLESCATRGRAPYKGVLTHGFTMDAKGRKMSKSEGNTVDPAKIINVNGADILRLWVASVDYTEDHRIGDEIIKGVSDQYRKLRNTFRYMLGALGDFEEAERVAVADMPELERYILHLLAHLDGQLRQAVDDYAFGKYMRALIDFAQDDLSAFFFDIRKDCLYCDVGPAEPQGTLKRRAYRTVLDTLFHALVRYVSPVLCFTAEEVWQTRYPDDRDSVHLKVWPTVDEGWNDEALAEKWDLLRNNRALVLEKIEPLRRDKIIRSSLEAEVWLPSEPGNIDFAELFISSIVHKGDWEVRPTSHAKCGRCWRHLPEVQEDGDLCDRCDSMLNGAAA